MSLSNYPPGVTGNEPQIAGYSECPRCGASYEESDSWENDGYLFCGECGYKIRQGFDPDRRRDE